MPAGPCARCRIVCVDPQTGNKDSMEPLYTLASYRRVKGQINFGILLQLAGKPSLSVSSVIQTGMTVHPCAREVQDGL